MEKAYCFIRENTTYYPLIPPSVILIDRRNLIETAYKNFLPYLKIRSIFDISISFLNELGEDQGALRREFLYLLFNSLISDDRIDKTSQIYDVNTNYDCPEFIYFYSTRRDQINTLDDILRDGVFDSRGYFILLGATIACLFLLCETFDVNFSLIFFENLLNRKYTLRHVQDIELQRNLFKYYHHEDLSGYGGTVEDFIFERIVSPRQNQYDYIKFGFDLVLDESTPNSELFSTKLAEKLSAFDFPFVFYHFEKITVEKLKNMTAYIKCDENTQEVRWFWDELKDKSQYFLSKLILFVTGSGCLPNDNLKSVLSLERGSEYDKLFRASACVNRLYVPRFTSKEKLSKYLEMSIMDSEGFHFV